jgi:MarR family transcriptional regulator, organic hydroperoxide resistance regulator
MGARNTLLRPVKRAAIAPKSRSTPHETRFELANRVFFRVYQSSNLVHRTGTRAVSAHDATTQQWAVMGALSRPGNLSDGMSVKELMALLAVSRQSLTIVLNRLEGLQLVARVRGHQDGRIRRVCLTRSGRSTWSRMLVDIRRYYASALNDFTDRELQALYRLLDRLKRRLAEL